MCLKAVLLHPCGTRKFLENLYLEGTQKIKLKTTWNWLSILGRFILGHGEENVFHGIKNLFETGTSHLNGGVFVCCWIKTLLPTGTIFLFSLWGGNSVTLLIDPFQGCNLLLTWGLKSYWWWGTAQDGTFQYDTNACFTEYEQWRIQTTRVTCSLLSAFSMDNTRLLFWWRMWWKMRT